MSAKQFNLLPENIREPIIFVFGAVVREQRQKRGWTAGRLAKLSGLRRQSINSIESNRTLANGESISRIGRAFGVPGSALMAMAEQRALQFPDGCQRCNYCCFDGGELKWLNPTRGCIRAG